MLSGLLSKTKPAQETSKYQEGVFKPDCSRDRSGSAGKDGDSHSKNSPQFRPLCEEYGYRQCLIAQDVGFIKARTPGKFSYESLTGYSAQALYKNLTSATDAGNRYGPIWPPGVSHSGTHFLPFPILLLLFHFPALF